MSLPLITCVCITWNRREWLPKAIACFERQTYSNRELLIVADGDPVEDLVPGFPQIRLVALQDHLTIGGKRNLGCELARGEFIAHWDDDDWSGPDRLADQGARLILSERSVTGYTRMRFTDVCNRWWRYRDEHYVFGTSLCYRRDWWQQHPFPAIPSGEDNAFCQVARHAEQLVYAEAGNKMYATVHPGNTSDRRLDLPCWEALSGFGAAA